MEVALIIMLVLFFIDFILLVFYFINEHRKKKLEPTVPKSELTSVISWYDSRLKDANEKRIKEVAEADASAQVVFANWKIKEEKRIRKDAVKRSKEVIKGKTTEHLIPYMGDFEYNPSDCRFMGSPIDLIIFNGLSDGELTDIVFLEIKAGKHASLTKRERQVRDALKEKRISWKMVKKLD